MRSIADGDNLIREYRLKTNEWAAGAPRGRPSKKDHPPRSTTTLPAAHFRPKTTTRGPRKTAANRRQWRSNRSPRSLPRIPMPTIDRALADKRLLGAGIGSLDSWKTWLVALKSAFDLPLDDDELKTFREIAGDRFPPDRRVRELWCVCGRRSGKSRIAAAVSIYLALFQKHKLAHGEKGVALVLAALATTNGVLIGISTPYRKLGLLFQKFRDHFGVDDDNILVVRGASKTFNPTLSDSTIAAQRAADPTAAGAEWHAEFRADIGAFLDDQSIDAAVDYSRPLELPPRENTLYHTFVDMGGGRHDASTIGIVHSVGEGDARRYYPRCGGWFLPFCDRPGHARLGLSG
jgi:hypothetical protein